ncbi:MAG: RHS repeat-associated core domain-containing protein [Oceanicaulis sp.]
MTPGENRSFGYDALGRLTTASGPWGAGAYSYDLLNNIRSKTLGFRAVDLDYDASGRLSRYRDTGAGGNWNHQTYDDRGNIISDGVNAFFYDRSERAVQISGPALGTMTYDAHGRRVRQIINGEIIYSVYGLDGTLLLRDNATTGETTDFIAMGGHTVGRFDETGAFTYIHSDHLGSASAATDAAGNILWTESYTPFGEIRHDPAANRDETGYTGHVRDAASGLVYAQARFYHPALGRFLSPDPVGFADMGPGYFNRYAYTINDPVNYTDPTGEEAYLISRPTGYGNANHMFVLVTDGATGEVRARFSYGPSRLVAGRLVSLTGTNSGTNLDDHNAAAAFLANPDAAGELGISAASINASDDAVIAFGRAADAALGTPDNPQGIAYAPLTNPLSGQNAANSNSAAYGVANAAVRSENPGAIQSLPPGSRNPGWGQGDHVPISGVVAVSGRIESNNLSECGERRC